MDRLIRLSLKLKEREIVNRFLILGFTWTRHSKI